MLPFNPRTTDLIRWLGQAKRQALLLFFGGGVLMGLVGVVVPPMGGVDPLWGQVCMVLALVLSLAGGLLTWFRAVQVAQGRHDPPLLVIGNLCVLLALLGEALRFDSQWSFMVILWPMVLVAGGMSRRWLWLQVCVTLFTVTVTAYAAKVWMNAGPTWFLKIFLVGLPVVFTGLVIGLFRHLALAEAQELRRVGQTDQLTGLLNRRALFDHVQDWLAAVPAAEQPALIMLDMDHFKRVNDLYGHAVGDEVLKAFAATLRASARPHDLLVRMGGEEFVWLTSDPDTSAILRRVERLRQQVGETLCQQDVTVSAGVAHSRGESVDLHALLKAADTALYQAKKAGRNRVVLSKVA